MAEATIEKDENLIDPDRKVIIALLLIGLSIRLVIHFASNGILWPDSLAYYRSAVAIGKNLDFSVHEIYRTPGYPAFLGAVLANFGFNDVGGFVAILIQRMLGLVGSVILYKTLKPIFSWKIAFAAALLFSLNTVQLYYEGVVQTEALFVFLFVSFVALFLKALRQPNIPIFFASGLVLGLVTLTRPIAQLLVLLCLVFIFIQQGYGRKSMANAATLLVTFIVVLLPWLYVNQTTYGFFGLSVDRGINLFHRVIDIDRMNAPETTKYKQIYDIVRVAQANDKGVYFEVYKFLRTKRHRSALMTDQIMKEYALEALNTKPLLFPWRTLKMFHRVFFHTRVSPHFCGAKDGPYMCSRTTRTISLPAFPNVPLDGFSKFRQFTRMYFENLAIPLRLISVLFILSVVFHATRRKWTLERAWLLMLILYFTGLTAIFNRAEDRFRLPVDGYLFAFAVWAVFELFQLAFTARQLTDQRT